MDDKAYYKRLSADAESWREAGLIDAEQEGALKSWAAMRARKAPAPFSTLSLLAAAAFIIGVLSVLAPTGRAFRTRRISSSFLLF